MAGAAQYARQFPLPSGTPPTLSAAHNDDRVWLKSRAKRPNRVPAQIDLYASLHRTLLSDRAQAALVPFQQHGRPFEGQRMRDNLRRDQRDPSGEPTRHLRRLLEGGGRGFHRCKNNIDVQPGLGRRRSQFRFRRGRRQNLLKSPRHWRFLPPTTQA